MHKVHLKFLTLPLGREFNEALVHQVVVAYAAGARQDTRAQKNRSDVSGGGKKAMASKRNGPSSCRYKSVALFGLVVVLLLLRVLRITAKK